MISPAAGCSIMNDAGIATVTGGNLMKLLLTSSSTLPVLSHMGIAKMDTPGRSARAVGRGCVTPGTSPAIRNTDENEEDAVKEESSRSKHEGERLLPKRRRQEIFVALVAAQDGGASVAESRKLVAQRCRVSEKDVRAIENEGVEEGWPIQ